MHYTIYHYQKLIKIHIKQHDIPCFHEYFMTSYSNTEYLDIMIHAEKFLV